MNKGYNGVSKELEKFAWWTGEMISYPMPEGKGAFIDCHNSQITMNYLFLHSGGDLHDQWGPVLTRSVRKGQLGLPWCSRRFLSILGAEVDNAWEGSQRCCFVMSHCLVGKSSHVGVDVDRLMLAVIKCIYLSPTYLHFVQDIEDRCLLLTSSMSFIDLTF
jgi:hypothetical protein